MNAKHTVTIAGSSGLVGSHLLKLLERHPSVHKIHALVRSLPDKPPPEKIEYRVIDFNDPSNWPEVSGDQFFCCLGTTIKKAGSEKEFEKVDFEYPLELARHAQKNDMHFHIITAVGSNKDSPFFYSRTKGKLENELLKLGFNKLSIYRPSLLLGERNENRPAEKVSTVLAPLFSPFLIGSLEKYRPVNAEDVAKKMITEMDDNFDSPVHFIEKW